MTHLSSEAPFGRVCHRPGRYPMRGGVVGLSRLDTHEARRRSPDLPARAHPRRLAKKERSPDGRHEWAGVPDRTRGHRLRPQPPPRRPRRTGERPGLIVGGRGRRGRCRPWRPRDAGRSTSARPSVTVRTNRSTAGVGSRTRRPQRRCVAGCPPASPNPPCLPSPGPGPAPGLGRAGRPATSRRVGRDHGCRSWLSECPPPGAARWPGTASGTTTRGPSGHPGSGLRGRQRRQTGRGASTAACRPPDGRVGAVRSAARSAICLRPTPRPCSSTPRRLAPMGSGFLQNPKRRLAPVWHGGRLRGPLSTSSCGGRRRRPGGSIRWRSWPRPRPSGWWSPAASTARSRPRSCGLRRAGSAGRRVTTRR